MVCSPQNMLCIVSICAWRTFHDHYISVVAHNFSLTLAPQCHELFWEFWAVLFVKANGRVARTSPTPFYRLTTCKQPKPWADTVCLFKRRIIGKMAASLRVMVYWCWFHESYKLLDSTLLKRKTIILHHDVKNTEGWIYTATRVIHNYTSHTQSSAVSLYSTATSE